MGYDLNDSVKRLLLEFRMDDPSDEALENEFEQAVKGDYESFVSKLKFWAGNDKIINFLKSGLTDGDKADDKFTATPMSIPAANLIPTQNEIDLSKSLGYSLKNPGQVKEFLTGSNITIGGAPVLTFNGKYIIDGHHRWSQIYCVNPKATLNCLNLQKSGLSPEDMLKATQVSIAATTGNIVVSTVKGINLLTAGENEVKQAIASTITDDVVKLYARVKGLKSKQEVINSLWEHCALMQRRNKPIASAPARGFMPQTNEPNGNFKNVITALTKGVANTQEPFIQNESKQLKEFQKDVDVRERTMFGIISRKLKEAGVQSTPQEIYSFIDYNYDLLDGSVDTMEPQQVAHNFLQYKRETKNEAKKSMKKQIREFGRDENWDADYDDGYPGESIGEITKIYFQDVASKIARYGEDELSSVDVPANYNNPFTNKEMILDFAKSFKDELFGKTKMMKYYQIGELYVQYLYEMGYNEPEDKAPGFQVWESKDLNKSLKSLLKEADEAVDPVDKTQLIQDLADVNSALSDAFAKLYFYKNQYVDNPQWQSALTGLRGKLSELIKGVTSTLNTIGMDNEQNQNQI